MMSLPDVVSRFPAGSSATTMSESIVSASARAIAAPPA
jgi:hypothetical protein